MLYTNFIQTLVQRSALAVGVLIALSLFFVNSYTAFAVGSPDGCLADNSVVNIVKSTASAEAGETITFTVTAGNETSADGCDITGRTMTLSLPNGNVSVFGPLDYANGTAVAFVGSEDYVADTDDLTAGSWTASVGWDGTQEDGLGSPSTGSKEVSVVLEQVDLIVTKTADPSAEEGFTWEIDKTVSPATWDLFSGDSGTSEYTIELTKISSGIDYSVEGEITIENPAQFADANVTDITDTISGVGDVTVTCPEATPFIIPAGEQVVCSYEGSLPDDTARTNTAVVTTSGDVGGGEDEVDFDPSQVVPVPLGGSVTIDDTFDEGDNGPFSDSNTYSYTRAFVCGADQGEFEGENNIVDNTATIVETQDSDDASVTINCYDLTVEKTADTTFDREYEWSIIKDADATELLLGADESYIANYDVTVDVVGFTDSNWMVSGQITVTNNHPTADAVIDLSDIISPGIDGVIDFGSCDGTPDLVLAGGSLTCDYGPVALPNGSDQTNTATAEQQNFDYDQAGTPSAGGTTEYEGSADVVFGDPENVIDEEVDVNDTFAGFLGTVAAGDAPVTFQYTREVGEIPAEECGVHQFDNTATFTTVDTATEGSDDHTILVDVPCQLGCTLTQGYWKTHSQLGPAPYDAEGWGALGDFDGNEGDEEEGEDWEVAGIDWYTAFWTPPQGGNIWYKLAHQFQAAYLNVANDAAAPSGVSDALILAEDWLLVNDPANKVNGKDAKEMNDWHNILASFNEGDIGPGHCD
jgi:hypothetical protein